MGFCPHTLFGSVRVRTPDHGSVWSDMVEVRASASKKKGYDLGGFVLLPYLGRLGSGPRITGQIWSEYGLVPAKKSDYDLLLPYAEHICQAYFD